ncbi:maleylpyruvate isomerase family mycothiol-dependent enzyme [Nocardioides zhouii]|uniref:Maleylpyruvate isomerase family mycothiol-dependent enzyme n=1 Tax=Nocardioides zhouii TaxID=1168729 RepID=A0A4Q2T3F7_9ACTN|nr:maleylpyruvate isomerase family mycothiol-dependent enzyme [Nocardioides zhouii]RYC13275.1 maleylpyruvate isomerase family mycothiol-dependent enzyme [Nocardioides zhouii]
MTVLVDQSIAELRATHDRLAAHVATLTAEDLATTSGADQWTVADVLSHLGSGAEIARHTLVAALGDDADRPENTAVWDRWNAMSPADQAEAFVASDARLVELYESLTPEQRARTSVDLGFLPAPVPVATAVGMRLNEQVMHDWDVRVATDPDAALTGTAAELLLQHYADGMGFMLGFIGKADRVDAPTRLAVGEHTLAITDSVAIEADTSDPTATYAGPLEAVVRLVGGRLGENHTPTDATVTGNVTLDELRQVFPGY